MKYIPGLNGYGYENMFRSNYFTFSFLPMWFRAVMLCVVHLIRSALPGEIVNLVNN